MRFSLLLIIMLTSSCVKKHGEPISCDFVFKSCRKAENSSETVCIIGGNTQCLNSLVGVK